ncbi:MAG TPA: response regulator, partial [Longimicrobiales bacterium]|nr:response regulator [Longimicrobiales bacterium]
RQLREDPDTAALPVIVLSARTGPRTQTECFALGADDYFEKPFDAELLAASVRARIRRSADLERQARHDELTGLPDRAAFRQAYTRLEGAPATLALLDLDRFGRINDAHGHAAGDHALRAAARLLRAALPADVELARWGGGAFAALFPGKRPGAARAALESAQRALAEAAVREPGGAPLPLAFSAGLARCDGGPFDEALADADHLLYLAKDRGRGLILAPGEEPVDTGATVLLCEDDAVTASLIKHRLGRERFDVRHFTDGLDAWAWAREEPPVDLAILDVKMPGMDGFELLGRLRELPAFRGVPLLMLTSMGSERDVVRGFELGADDYIVKPFSPAELVARLHRHLRRA